MIVNFLMKRRILICCIAISLFTFFTASASYQNSVEAQLAENGVTNPMGMLTIAEQQAADEKVNDMQRLMGLLNHSASHPTLSLASNDNTYDEVYNIVAKYTDPTRVNAVMEQLLRVTPTGYIDLGLALYKQETDYYCGPASAYMVLIPHTRNLTQSQLAKELGTTTSGTGLGSNWIPVMKKYSYRDYSVISGSSKTPAAMTDTAIATMAQGYGVVYNTVQYANGSARLVGYDNLNFDVYHYVAGGGYDNSNPSSRDCIYLDPTNVRSSAYGYHTIKFGTMCTLIHDRGMIA